MKRFPLSQWSLAIVFSTVCGALLLAGGFRIWFVNQNRSPAELDGRDHPLDPIRTGDGFLGRRIIGLPGGECVVLHRPIKYFSRQEIRDALNPNPSTTEDDLQLYRDTESRWFVPEENASQYTTFNCATYALGDAVGLSKLDWIEPFPTAWTQQASPAQAIIDAYFELLVVYPVSEVDWDALATSTSFKDDDVIAFAVNSDYGTYAHLGKIQKRGAENLMLSKLGFGPIAIGSIHATSLRYTGTFDEVRIFRRLPLPVSSPFPPLPR